MKTAVCTLWRGRFTVSFCNKFVRLAYWKPSKEREYLNKAWLSQRNRERAWADKLPKLNHLIGFKEWNGTLFSCLRAKSILQSGRIWCAKGDLSRWYFDDLSIGHLNSYDLIYRHQSLRPVWFKDSRETKKILERHLTRCAFVIVSLATLLVKAVVILVNNQLLQVLR